MKRIFIFMSVAAVCLSFASCSKETESTPVVPVVTETPVFTAGTDEVGNVKSQLGSDLNIYWKPADTLKMFYGKGDYLKCYSKIKDTCKSATFYTKDTPPEGPVFYWGLYPFTDGASFDSKGETISTMLPKVQSGVAGTFDDGLFLTVTKNTEATNYSFKNVCSCFKFSLSSELDDVTEVTLSGNNGEKIAGNVFIGFDEDLNPTHREADADSISLTPKKGDYFMTGKVYYIVCLPNTFGKGISLKLNSESKGFCVRSTSAKYVLGRNKVVDLGEQNASDFTFIYKDKFTGAEGAGITLATSPKIMWAPFNVGGKDTLSYPVNIGDSTVSFDTKDRGLVYGGPNFETELCPDGWRIPTQNEAKTFIGNDGEPSTEYFEWRNASEGKVAGCRIYGNKEKTGNYLFFPACGNAGDTEEWNEGVGAIVDFATEGDKGLFLNMFTSTEERSEPGISAETEASTVVGTYARSVRCVRDL